ncbi:MAG: glutamyl-tRNA reductase [Deltaproteobacteria bacterium]
MVGKIVLLGLNHQTAPVELRECIAISKNDTADALLALIRHEAIDEVVVLSTCNRVEVLMVTENAAAAVDAATNFIAEFNRIPRARFENSLYAREGSDAVKHLFKVAASLDSMILGEPQILGQIKEAYNTATQHKTTGVILNRLMHRAFFVAKKIRSETGIGDRAVSGSYAAIELGKKIFDTLEGRKALLVGAGEMAELAVEHLIRHKAGKLYVANRTFERAVKLATQFNGQPIQLEELSDILHDVDIIISSTGSSGYVIRPKQVKQIMHSRKNRPLFFIDIAVPRDIDPAINRLNNVYVYDIDDLQGVIEENIEDRKKEAVKGERLIDEAVIRFRNWYDNLQIVPTIVDLRKKFDSIAAAELEKTVPALGPLSDKERGALHKMIASMINKMMHDPTQLLKSEGKHINKSIYLDITRRLFKLDE